ncbi:DUF1127 domain-containing protein [Pseudomonas sp. MWU13-3659]|uniref:DUF1127 domain-containing protein n=1 Tax=Pseudomonas sp. MWU13-3659 TaxID=2986964 RepID=UPI002075005F|nr:DUF1127 domain-containing protein [Pseudomonas sp. MWU13-3659]
MLLHKMVDFWTRWRSLRLEHRELLNMPEHRLRDIGLTREDILLESRSPVLTALMHKYKPHFKRK